jgi:hypothetical protein
MANGAFPPEVKQPTDHSTPCGAEGKDKWSYTSTSSMCVHDVQRNNFTFITLTYICTDFFTIFKREDDTYIWQYAVASE